MITDLMDMLFGCWHLRYSWPLRDQRGDYVACLDCGSEFHYSFDEMKIGERRRRRVQVEPPRYEPKAVEKLVGTVPVQGRK